MKLFSRRLFLGSAALAAFIDNDPATVPDWGLAIAAIAAGLGLLFARDNNVSSEDAGIK